MSSWAGDPDFESADDLYHRAPCGYLTLLADGTVVRCNQTFAGYMGSTIEDIVGHRRFSELLTVGGRIYHETHLRPLLHLQDEVRDVALDLRRSDGTDLPVLVNATLVRRDGDDRPLTRVTVFDASARREYERELLRARRAAEESERAVRDIAETLQRSLLEGSLAGGDGFRIETRYQPASGSLEVGGDWYDSFAIGDGRCLGVSVGDVVGKGIDAACAMGQVRSALRALATTGAGPAVVLGQLDRFVARVPDAFCTTVAYAEVDLVDRTVRYSCAGHPPPVRVTAAGDSVALWGGRGAPLGASLAAVARPEDVAPFDAGDRLLLYSDGLIERRDRDIDTGFELLIAEAARLCDRDLVPMVDGVMASMLADGTVRDDVCLLVAELADAPPVLG